MPAPTAAFFAVFDTPLGAVTGPIGVVEQLPETTQQVAEVSFEANRLARACLSDVYAGLEALGHTEEEALGAVLAYQVEVYLVSVAALPLLGLLPPTEQARQVRAAGAPPLVRLNGPGTVH